MKQIAGVMGTCFSAAILAACGGSGLSPSAPTALTSQIAASESGYESLYSFKGGKNGAFPVASLTAMNGTLYGTTACGGGAKGCKDCGTVFSVTITGKERVLHRFTGYDDACDPQANMIAVHGTLYGTTASGGGGRCIFASHNGCGAIYSISPSGSHYEVLYAFKGHGDGAFPTAGLIYANGTFYGTTSSGGKYGVGTAFAITPSGELHVLHAFGNTHDGRAPDAGLTILNGVIYGTTPLGGMDVSRGQGTVVQSHDIWK